MDISGATAIIVGGASGLGSATARHLAELGAKVAIFDQNRVMGEAVADAIGGAFCSVDIIDDGNIDAGFEAVQDIYGTARILVNCAGIAPVAKTIGQDGRPHESDLFRKVIAINLVGTFTVLTRFAACLAAADSVGEERGVIINTASIAAFDGPSGQIAYAASKGGVAAMTLSAARDLAPHKIRVMTIAPGMFRTAMVDMLSDSQKVALGARVPFPNRLGFPEEFARLVENIITNPMLNGDVIRLDGAHRL
jgi:NAD(P)-dependent dehydrogenase (short-subunit alcohol dehydrogenase family)